jgi:hypothetical protein
MAQKADIFPKLLCQKSYLTKGSMAIESNIPTKGKTEYKGNWPNSDPAAKRFVIKT